MQSRKPLYKLQARCLKLRWDGTHGYWWCCQTSPCYKNTNHCPLIEATAKEAEKGNVRLNSIMPISIQSGVKQWIVDHQTNKQLSFNF